MRPSTRRGRFSSSPGAGPVGTLIDMRMPRVECPRCRRSIAAGPVAGNPGRGRVWRHDEPGKRRTLRDALVSCPGSLTIVDLSGTWRQPELPPDADVGDQDDDQGQVHTLF